jgi:hypothetical protein
MGVASSIRLCFPMRKSILLPYPDGNDKGRKFPSRNASMIIPIFFSYHVAALLRLRLYDCR